MWLSIVCQGYFLPVKLRIAWDFKSVNHKNLTLCFSFSTAAASASRRDIRCECVHNAGASAGKRRVHFVPGGWQDALGAEIPGGEDHEGVCDGCRRHRCSSEVKEEFGVKFFRKYLVLKQFLIVFFLYFIETQPSSTIRPVIPLLKSSHLLSTETRK